MHLAIAPYQPIPPAADPKSIFQIHTHNLRRPPYQTPILLSQRHRHRSDHIGSQAFEPPHVPNPT